MKKKLILIMLLFIPFIVKAENIEKKYELCKSGCEYTELTPILQDIMNVDKTKVYDFTIEIKDGEEYIANRPYEEMWYVSGSEANKSTFTVKGTTEERPTIKVESSSLVLLSVNQVTFENVILDAIYVSVHTCSEEFNGLEKLLTIKNSEIKAQDMFLSDKNAYLENVKLNIGSILAESGEKATFKNVEITINDSGSQYFAIKIKYPTAIIEDSTITLNTKEFEVSNLELNNTTINGNVVMKGTNKYTDSKINGELRSVNGTFDLDNVEVTKGIIVSKDYCALNTTPSNNTIKNSKISNQGNYALVLNVRDNDTTVDVYNSDLDNSSCSIVSDSPVLLPCGRANYTQNIRPTFLSYTDSLNIQVNVHNSKVNCAMTSSTDTSINAINMYFADNNEWTKTINRGTDPTKFNIVELQNGHIYIDHKKTDVLRLNVDKDKPISAYFEDVLGDAEVLGEWIIGDPSILKIENGKIIPLKVGVTTISGVVNSEIYTIEITVKAEDLNPNTKDIVIAIIACTITAGLILIIAFDKYKQSKVI